jgi:signal transduction histidine kinase
VRIFVRDNGPGIPEGHREKVFQPFRRLHSRRTVEGSGLGLSIVQTVVDRLGGSIDLESAVGKGSTFSIRLPLDGPDPGEPPES